MKGVNENQLEQHGQPGIGLAWSEGMWCVGADDGTEQHPYQKQVSDINERTKRQSTFYESSDE
jgi:hypothetical protein